MTAPCDILKSGRINVSTDPPDDPLRTIQDKLDYKFLVSGVDALEDLLDNTLGPCGANGPVTLDLIGHSISDKTGTYLRLGTTLFKSGNPDFDDFGRRVECANGPHPSHDASVTWLP